MSPPITTLAPSELPPAAVAPPAPPNRMPERTETDDHAAPRRSLSKRLAIGLLLIVAATALYFKSTAATREWNEAVASYTRGAKEAARLNFTRFATRHPDDARPRVYLGRIAREDQDYQTARQYLDTAVRLNPQSAMAQREMGSAMLAVNDPELARRFYVRALQLDDTDRPAMGFLGCALARLGRLDEARRWIERAGPGEWSECVTAPASTPDNAPLTTTRPTR
jgi:tetratricopeptide (TPR) repeat protein